MHVIVVIKNRLENMPPILSAIMLLDELGHKVSVINENVPDFWQEYYRNHGIKYYVTSSSIAGNSSSLKKIKSYMAFRKEARAIISKIYKDDNASILWIEGPQTIISLGTGYVKKFKYVLMIEELHDASRYFMKAIGDVIHKAKAVFMPEYNRGMIYKVWFKLEKQPFLLPNKPYLILDDKQYETVLSKYRNQVQQLSNKKVILYQGGIKRIRMLDKIAKAINEIGNSYHLLVVGPEQENGVINELKRISPEVTHIDFIPAPYYLAFCKIAYIGYVIYEPNSLNNIFCAPNKIFEYSAFGLPMIANDIPGLRFTVGVSGACELVDPTNINSIIAGLSKIEQNYTKYKESSVSFHNSVDNKKTISDVMNSLVM